MICRGFTYQLMDRLGEAIADQLSALELDASNAPAHCNLALSLLSSRQPEAALARCRQAFAVSQRSDLLSLIDDVEQALQTYGSLEGAEEMLQRIERQIEALSVDD